MSTACIGNRSLLLESSRVRGEEHYTIIAPRHKQFILDKLKRLESSMGFGMLPAQPVFQQQYLPPTSSYQHGYPTTPVTTTSNIYQQQVTPA